MSIGVLMLLRAGFGGWTVIVPFFSILRVRLIISISSGPGCIEAKPHPAHVAVLPSNCGVHGRGREGGGGRGSVEVASMGIICKGGGVAGGGVHRERGGESLGLRVQGQGGECTVRQGERI
jgi:hypothetical protein